MNNRHEHDRQAHELDPEDATIEHEWRAQERARQQARAGNAPSGDAMAADYHCIAVALRMPLPDRLPSNFAFQVAQLATRLPRTSRLDLRLERWLVRALVAALLIGSLVVVAVYGVDWLRALEATGANAGAWTGLGAACLLLSWGLQGWRTLRRGAIAH